MVLGFGRRAPTTIAEEDPRGTKVFQFTSGARTRGELQDDVERILSQYHGAGHNVAGADAVMDRVTAAADFKLLASSPSVQSVILGDNGSGPIDFFIREARESLRRRRVETGAELEECERIEARYRELRERLESARIQQEDPSGTRRYAFSFGAVQGSELQQRMEDMLSQYGGSFSSAANKMDGAEAIMDMFASPADMGLLRESPKSRATILGSPNHQGPVDYLLEKAGQQLEKSEEKAPKARLARLNARYDAMKLGILGTPAVITKKPASFAARDMHSGHVDSPGAGGPG